MAVIPFVRQELNLEGDVYKSTPLATSDETSVLVIPTGNNEVTVHIYGTVGGSTVAVVASLAGVQFNTVDDAYGTAMSYTALTNVIKPIGPAVNMLKITVTGGAGVAVTVDVYIVRKVRP